MQCSDSARTCFNIQDTQGETEREGEGEGGRERKWPEPNRNSEGFEAEEQTESLKVGALRPNQRHTKAAFFTGPSMDALSSLKIHSRCRCAEKKGFWR